MIDTYLYSLLMWLGCVYIYFELHYVPSHVIHAIGYMGTFIPYMHVNFRIFLNILVFKQVMINGIVDSSKNALKSRDELTYLKVNLNM